MKHPASRRITPKSNENKLIFKALLKYRQPLTRRRLSEITGIQITSLCRALNYLDHKYKILEIAKIAPCQTTGKRVYHYYFRPEVRMV